MSLSSLTLRTARSLLAVALVATLGLVAARPAHAQDGTAAPADTAAPTGRTAAPLPATGEVAPAAPAAPPAPLAAPPAPAAPAEPVGNNPGAVAPPTVGPPAGAGTASYHSPMRTTCEDELAKDKDWFLNLKSRLAEQINRNVHIDAANYATQNNKHVIGAYAVFWVLTAGFVLLMWRRQRALQGELTRLEGELARALKEGGGA